LHKRSLRALTLAMTVAMLAAGVFTGPAAAAQSRVARVALIVGPAGAVTSRYRGLANDAAEVARAAGAEVVTVYSPNATWSAVKRAVAGASLVVYLGHGNGWPSPYRDSLYPRSQNGFGLNPVAGRNDSDHQYFGESSIEKLRFADNAVVIFSHLCYASGNSEPGVAEGSADVAVQRVDNYAAGFIRAGAHAVVAETALGPAYYVKAILKGRGTIQSIWDAAPTANGHTFGIASVRTPGYSVQLDPNRRSSGFVRSLVSRGVTAAQVRAGALGTTAGLIGSSVPAPPEPSLARKGIAFSEPAFKTLPIAGATTTLTLPVARGRTKSIPAGVEVSVRWDPILLDAPTATAAPAAPAETVTPVTAPPPSGRATPLDPGASPTATASATPEATPTQLPAAPDVALVVAAEDGTVVEPAKATRATAGLRLTVHYPSAPGLYRLSALLHTKDGVAYDDATQAMLTPVLVKVGRPIAAAYGVPAALSLDSGSTIALPVNVMNSGSQAWNLETTAPKSQVGGEDRLPDRVSTSPSRLVATWVSADGHPVPDPVSVMLGDEVSAPGGLTEAKVGLVVPKDGGEYLLLLDVVSPANGPLSALGSAPALVRISVNAPVSTPSPSPAAAPVLQQPQR
jgi:hypothetical protein